MRNSYNNQIGIAYNELKDYKSAITILSQAIEQSDNPQSSFNSQLYGNRGNAYANLKDYQSALADYNQAIKLAPSVAEPYLSRALLYYDLKDVPKGDRDVDKGVQLLKQSIYDGYSDESQLEDIANAFKLNGKPEAERKIQGAIAYSKASHLTNQAVKLAELNKHQEAIKLHNQAIAIDPQERFHYTARGASYYALKEYKLALKDFDKAIEVNPKYAPAYAYRSVIYRELKDYQKALSDSNKAISVNPELALAYHIRGGIYYRLNQLQKAKNNWQKAAELYDDPSSSGIGQYDGQEGTLEEKLDQLQQNAQKDRRENDLESYYANKAALKQFQIVYYKEKGDDSLYGREAILSSDDKAVPINKQKAIEFYTKAIALDDQYVDAYVPRGSAYKDLKNYPKAIADLEKIIELTQDPWVYRDLANLYIDLKDYKSALSTFTKAIAAHPDSDIYIWRADLYLLQLKDYPKAISDYTKTIENYPEQERSYLNRGQAYLFLKKYNLAIADFTKAIEDYPEYTDAYYNRGVTHAALKDYPAGIKDLTKAIEICNKDEYGNICTDDKASFSQIHLAQLYLDRSRLYSILKQYSNALTDINKVVLLEPKNADAYLQRGSAYYSLKNDRQAKENWQTAAKLYKQQGNFQLMFTKIQNQAQVEKQKGDVELYRKVQQVIEIFEQFQ